MDETIAGIIALVIVACMIYTVAQHCVKRQIEIIIVAVDPPFRLTSGNDTNSLQKVYTTSGFPLLAFYHVASKLGPGRWKVEVIGWEIPKLGMYRRITRVIKWISN